MLFELLFLALLSLVLLTVSMVLAGVVREKYLKAHFRGFPNVYKFYLQKK